MFEYLCGLSESCIRCTLHFGWGILNVCVDLATPVTGPADSPPVLHLSGCVSLRVKQHTLVTKSSDKQIHITKRINLSPGLNSTMAFRQANSVGSTARPLKRLKTSSRMRRSAVGGESGVCCGGERSGRHRRGQLSMGKDHWMAHKRNISLQASSRRITWGCHGNTLSVAPMCKSVQWIYKKRHFLRLTWSRNGKWAKTGKFFAHLTDMKRSLADVSYILSEQLEVYGDKRQSEGDWSLSESLVVTSMFSSTVHWKDRVTEVFRRLGVKYC